MGESEQGSSKETLPSWTSSALASGRRSNRAVSLELRGTLGFYFYDARTLEPTYPARCHINVVPLMYVNEASDRLSGGKIWSCCSCREHTEPPALPSGPVRAVLLAYWICDFWPEVPSSWPRGWARSHAGLCYGGN